MVALAIDDVSEASTAPGGKTHVVGCTPWRAVFAEVSHVSTTSTHPGCERVGYDLTEMFEDEALLFVNGNTKYYYSANHLYSVAAMTNAAGAVVERYSYTAYGKRTVMNATGATIPKSTINQQVGFTGQYIDSETGAMYFRGRMYLPPLGRFMSRDPLGYVDGLSLYAGYFVPNKVDPSGFIDEDDFTPVDPSDPDVTGEDASTTGKFEIKKKTHTTSCLPTFDCSCKGEIKWTCHTKTKEATVKITIFFKVRNNLGGMNAGLLQHEYVHSQIYQHWKTMIEMNLRRAHGRAEDCDKKTASKMSIKSWSDDFDSRFTKGQELLGAADDIYDKETNHGSNQNEQDKYNGIYGNN